MSQSFEDRYYLTNPTLWQRCKRDICLYSSSLMFLLLWCTKGRKIRQGLKDAQDTNGSLNLNEITGEESS
jgi:hypothetical protein